MGRPMSSCTYFDLVDMEPDAACHGRNQGFFSYLENEETSIVVGVDEAEVIVISDMYMRRISSIHRREVMKAYLNYEMADIPVMIGAGFFFSSVTGTIWSISSNTPAPAALAMVSAVAGLVIGGVVSVKARKKR